MGYAAYNLEANSLQTTAENIGHLPQRSLYQFSFAVVSLKMVYELQVWWLMLILNQRSIGGWEVLGLTFMYTFYPESLYQVLNFIFHIFMFLYLFLYIMDLTERCCRN